MILTILTRTQFFLNFMMQQQSFMGQRIQKQRYYLGLMSPHTVFITLLLILSLLSATQCKQTKIIHFLRTNEDRIAYRILKHTNAYIETQRIIDHTIYKCFNILQNKLTKNNQEKISNSTITFHSAKIYQMHYQHQNNHHGNKQTIFTSENNQQSKQWQENQEQTQLYNMQYRKQYNDEYEKNIDLLLDLLEGICIEHFTNEFIYEYCHKESVRQFDSPLTKQLQNKQLYQDINLGVWNTTKYQIETASIMKIQDSMKAITVPLASSYRVPFNNERVQETSPNSIIQKELSHDHNIIHLSSPIFHYNIFMYTHPQFYKVTCFQNIYFNSSISTSNSTHSSNIMRRKKIEKYALGVSPYELLLMSDEAQAQCDSVLDYSYHFVNANNPIQYFQSDSRKAYKNYMYGDLVDFCTQSYWAWDKSHDGSDSLDLDNYLQPGSMLLIEVYNKLTNKYHKDLYKVEEIISPYLIKLDKDIGVSFPKQFKFADMTTLLEISNISSCQLLTKRTINLTHIDTTLQYNGGHRIKIPSNHKFYINQETKLRHVEMRYWPGDQIFCICSSKRSSNNIREIDFQITIGQHIFGDYYQAYYRTNTRLYDVFTEEILQECVVLKCYKYSENNKPSTHQQDASTLKNQEHVSENIENNTKFTQIHVLTPKKRIFSLESNASQSQKVYLINIYDSGLLIIQTLNPKTNISYEYLISELSIIKIAYHSNGTKQIIRSNSYYENETLISQQFYLYKTYYLYISRHEKNGKIYGGIWKYFDRVAFPRIEMEDEELKAIVLKDGYAYLRILDTNQMTDKRSIAILSYHQKLLDKYLFKESFIKSESKKEKLEEKEKEKEKEKKEEKNKQQQLNQQNLKDEKPATATAEESLMEKQKRQNIKLLQFGFLNESTSVNYTYTHGQFCGPPINKHRTTTAILKCGQPWFKIQKIMESSPCVYIYIISTKLLCRHQMKKVVEKDQDIFPQKDKNNIQINYQGTICHTRKGIFNKATMYFYFGKDYYSERQLISKGKDSQTS